MRGGTSLAAERLIGRLGLAAVLGGFGVWELVAPAEWSGYVPHLLAAHLPTVPLVLAHGWLLLMVGMALLIDFLPGVAVWVAVGVMGEVVVGLLVTSGFSDILLRDLGLLALALVTALGSSRRTDVPARP
jgi:hypothetical protein